ncbi:MAG: flagellin [Rhodospirillaceae bacterium]|jgi:flagellin|nr:flagellin [Rhodospirillaceae bacterium]|tara:strand:+ start:642 stop:1466 length:825 start_codon:yes stop_codon:yes gene_type:complete
MALANSINTNVGALVALRNLNATNKELGSVQDRVSTGLKVIGALDDASSFAIAQGLRADIKAIGAVQQGLSNGRGVSSVAVAGTTEISNLLADIKKKITEGMNAGNTTSQQNILDADYGELVDQVLNFIQNSEFNGKNMLDNAAADVAVIADTSGGSLTIRAQDLQSNVFDLLNAEDLSTTTAATAALSVVNTAIDTVGTALGQLGADSRALEFQDNFLNSISDALDAGLGSIVDADLAKESARLQALQVKQQLGVQTLSIANASPQVLLSLFR